MNKESEKHVALRILVVSKNKSDKDSLGNIKTVMDRVDPAERNWKKDMECLFFGDLYDQNGVPTKIAESSLIQINEKVQIVGVADYNEALKTLGDFKFDLVLFDCDPSGGTDNGTKDVAGFFNVLKDNNNAKGQAVLNNRGPLNCLWVMLCANNMSSVSQALQNNDIPLVRPQWRIDIGPSIPQKDDNGCTRRIKLIIDMQLKGCIFDQDDLIGFLSSSGKRLKDMYVKRNKKNEEEKVPQCRFHEFQAFMGAEFSTFLLFYGARHVIRRDARLPEGDDPAPNSVFSTWVWNHFYNNDSDSNRKLFALHRLMLAFYQLAATMPEDRNGIMRLRETFRRLRYFIDTNVFPLVEIKKGNSQKSSSGSQVSSKPQNFDEWMDFIANSIDVALQAKEIKN